MTSRSPLTEAAIERLTRALGSDGERYAFETMRAMGVDDLATAADLLRFANHLLTRTDDMVLASAGRALRVSALLRGARDDASSA